METKKILQADILDIIFDQRNKTYGAYELRKNYERRARKAFSIAMLFTLIVISVPVIAAMFEDELVLTLPDTGPTVIITDFPPDVIPPEPTDPKQPETNHTNDIPTDIVPAEDDTQELIEDEPEDTPSDPGSSSEPSGNGNLAGVPGGTGSSGENSGTTIIPDPVPEPDPIVPDYLTEEQPEFPGGEDALIAYLNSHIKYPEKAVNNEAAGKVVLGFVVNKDGEIDDLQILKSVGYGCDEEAMRVVRNMPKWKPGRNNGKAVRVYFNLPITFELK